MHVDVSKVEAAAVGDQGQAARQGHVTRVASRSRGAQLALAPGRQCAAGSCRGRAAHTARLAEKTGQTTPETVDTLHVCLQLCRLSGISCLDSRAQSLRIKSVLRESWFADVPTMFRVLYFIKRN